jgi:hypothetical protein
MGVLGFEILPKNWDDSAAFPLKSAVLTLTLALLGLATTISRATPVVWGAPPAPAPLGVLDATIIPTSTTGLPVIYTNVNNEGYDIAISTSGLSEDGLTTVSGTDGWWFAGSNPGESYATVTVNFYLTGTFLPVAMQGVDILFEDAENQERFGNFSYFDDFGTANPVLFNNSAFFSYSDGGVFFNNFTQGANSATQEGGTQLGETMEINLTGVTTSGFTFGTHRQNSSAGSVIMMGLGDLSVAPIVAWRQSFFGGAFVDSSISGDNANPAGDGIANLLKYAFGLDPTMPETSGLPVITDQDGFLQASFNILSADTDITYIVETSDDLVNWEEDSTYSAAAGNQPYNGETIQLSATPTTSGSNIVVTDTMPLSVTPRRFMRVLVTRP